MSMRTCLFDSSKSLQKIVTDQNVHKMVGARLVFTVAINTLAMTLLGGSKKQAVLIGATTSLGGDLLHFMAHRVVSDKLVAPAVLLSTLIIPVACSYFSNIPPLSLKTLAYVVCPFIAFFPTEYVLKPS
ncbi:MAG: hypothetical protein H7A41_05870 [Chlamydiales bacterium]|nr:hypothetical protein [Chlamydiales bacterium]